MSVLLIFVDGMGLGANDPETNPFFHAPMRTLRGLFGKIPTREDGALRGENAILVPTDATLGVPGLPQSGTGQTTIFTGVNAPAAIGEHLGPYPNAALRELLKHDNIFQRVQALGLRTAFADAYPPFFFERLNRGTARRTATMQAALAAGVTLRGVEALARGEAVSGLDMSNRYWVEHGAPVPLITSRQAGENLMRIAMSSDLTVFEYAPTDMAGHKDDRARTLKVLEEIDECWGGAIDALNADEDSIVIVSDHGNVEDWSTTQHTLNPVPTILVGAGREQMAAKIRTLADITPAVVELLGQTG